MYRVVLKIIMTAMVLMAIAPSAGSETVFNHPADVDAITAIEEQLATSTSMDELIDYYADDAVVLDLFAPGYYRGREAIYAGFAPQLAATASYTHEMPDLNIISNGKFACAALQLRFHLTRTDGTQGDITLRQLDAFKKIDGRWLIAQQHISFPIDAVTGKGILNGPMPVRGPIAWSAKSFSGIAVTPDQGRQEISDWLEEGARSPDLETLMKYYGPGDDVLVYDMVSPPGEFRGLKEIRDGFAPVMNFTEPKARMLDLVIDSDGSFGILISVQDINVKQEDGSERRFMLRENDCLRRVDGRWYSVMEALSIPVDPATGMGVSDPSIFVVP
jgi:ketosteroid isomerase-like protein